MVQRTLRIRQMNGYHYPNKIDTITLDSSSRLEELLLKSKTGGATLKRSSLYLNGRELALNSSIASHNLQNYTIIESCKSPYISAALSSLLKDLEYVQKHIPNDQRDKEKLMKHLEYTDEMLALDGYWNVNQWSNAKLTQRIICLATMKGIIQRDNRYGEFDLPHCKTVRDLHDNMIPVWVERDQKNKGGGNGGGSGRRATTVSTGNDETVSFKFNNPGNLFKPITKRSGKPSTIYLLLEKKLQILHRIVESSAQYGMNNDPNYDPVENFIVLDEARRKNNNAATTTGTSATTTTTTTGSSNRRGRRNTAQNAGSSPRRSSNGVTTATSTQHNDTTSTATTATRRTRPYCPEYASGPFAVLSTLYKAMHPNAIMTTRNATTQQLQSELSLTEEKLKHRAQPTCRSNLYDRNLGRGSRNAFACMEGLAGRQLVRKERGNFHEEDQSGEDVYKWQLLEKGEEMGKHCFEFEQAVDQVLPKILKGGDTTNQEQRRMGDNNLVLVVDNREDKQYRKRLKWYCEDDKIPSEERELPAGDYLFMTKDENVVPLIVERKSWSDLADSVVGRGKGHRRLDCVKIDNIDSAGRRIEEQHHLWQQKPHCTHMNCQLCKMKRSGCTQILFIIEGGWCSNKDHGGYQNQNKCTAQKRCQSCQALSERHHNGMTQDILEKVLHRLQVQHGCHVHYTNGFNETISSLQMIRELLMEGNDFASLAFESIQSSNVTTSSAESDDLRRAIAASLEDEVTTSSGSHLPLTYKNFVSNVKKKSTIPLRDFNPKNRDVIDWTVQYFGQHIVNEEVPWRQSLGQKLFAQSECNRKNGSTKNGDPRSEIHQQKRQKIGKSTNEVITLDLSDDDDNSRVIDLVDKSIETDNSSTKLIRPNPISDVIEIPDSQETGFEVIEIEDSQQSNQLLYDSDSDTTIVVVDNNNQVDLCTDVDQSSSTSRCQSGCTPISTQEILKARRLIILREVQFYNDKFMKDINQICKNMYNLRNTALTEGGQSVSNVNILDQSIEEIENLKLNKNFPLVRKEALIYTTLYIQIKLGILLRIATRDQYADQLKEIWTKNSMIESEQSNENSSSGQNFVDHSSSASFARGSHINDLTQITQVQLKEKQSHTNPIHRSHRVDSSQIAQVQQKERQLSSRTASHQNTHRRRTNLAHTSNTSPVTRTSTKRTIDGSQKKYGVKLASSTIKSEKLEKERAARLRRFDSTYNSRVETEPKTNITMTSIEHGLTWNCDQCTFENTVDTNICIICNNHRVKDHDTKLQRLHRNNSISLARPLKSTVKKDNFGSTSSFQDKIEIATENVMSVSTPQSKTSHISTSSKSGSKCGACGLYGHNRRSANAQNCPAFNNPEEIELREKKWRKIQEKANTTEQEFIQRQADKRLLDEQRAQTERDLQKIMEENKKVTERVNKSMDEELKRLERAAKRAKRQAERQR
jgi:hypothetical protein